MATNQKTFIIQGGVPGEKAGVSVPFTPDHGMTGNDTVAYELKDDGINVTKSAVRACLYDADKQELNLIGYTGGYYMIDENRVDFIDVSADDWFYGGVLFASAREIFAGVGNGMFAPYARMTHGMFVTALANLDDIDPALYDKSPFSDVDINAWYGPAVEWAYEAGIIDAGVLSDNKTGAFAPDGNVTREQMAEMTANYIKYKDLTLSGTDAPEFSDITQASEAARQAIRDMRAHGIISGVVGNLYNPKSEASRAEVAQIFTNLIVAMFE